MRSSAQRDADELRAASESEEMLEAAETRSRDLARSAEAIWRERRRLIDDMRGIGEQLVAIGDVEGKRFAKLSDEIPVAAAHNGEPAATARPSAQPIDIVSSDRYRRAAHDTGSRAK